LLIKDTEIKKTQTLLGLNMIERKRLILSLDFSAENLLLVDRF
jgi:hypothetical protein